MADKKISELTELTTPDGTEELVVNDSGTSKKITQTNLLSTALPKAGGTMTGDLDFDDAVYARFGDSDDLQIYHQGGNSHIRNSTGDLYIEDNDGNIYIRGKTGEDSIRVNVDGSVQLYNDNLQKLATTSTGIDVTGSVTCDGFTSTGIDDNATSTAITINASENVGIGTTSPLSKLDVSGSFITVSQGAATTGRIGSSDNIAGGTANDLIIQATGSTVTRFFQSGAESIRLDTDGLKFNGDTAAANALDDYEEGTWTPVFGGGMTYTLITAVAKYVKVGRLVSFTISMQWGSKSGGTGNVPISLPFATSSTSSSWQGNFTIGYSGGVTGIPKTGYNDSGQANFFMVPAAIGGGIVQTSAIGSAGHLIMGGSYQTD